MNLPTLGDLKDKVERALALEDEQFVVPEELADYANDGIDEAEAEIHAAYPDYFLSRSSITLVSGQEEYDLPSDIYAFKIRSLVYKNGTDIYEIKKIRDWKKFIQYGLDSLTVSTNQLYQYLILNQSAGAQKLVLSPTPQEDGQYITVWYIRNANTLTDDTDECDIPEFSDFVVEYMKMRCYEKEGHPNYMACKQRVEEKRKLMIDTLTNMIEDTDNEIEADFRAYDGMTGM